MPVPRQVTDGSYARPQQVGSNDYVLPFSDRGDQVSFEVHQKWRVDYTKFVRSKPMTQINSLYGKAYLVTEGPISGIGQGLLEFNRIYASVPQTRREGLTWQYMAQAFSGSEVGGLVLSMDATEVWEYSLTRLPSLTAPRIENVLGSIVNLGRWGNFRPGQIILAQNTDGGIYKGKIYYRRSVQIVWPEFNNLVVS